MSYNDLENYMNNGRSGKNIGLPTGFNRLGNEVMIRKGTASIIFGAPGSAKTALCHQMNILKPFEYCYSKNIPLKIFLFSMERDDIFYRAKWLLNQHFKETGVLLDIKRVLGWIKGDHITNQEMGIIEEYRPYFEKLDEYLDVHKGSKTPEYIYNTVMDYIKKNGNEGYIVPIIDHTGLTSAKGSNRNKKGAIDDLAEVCKELRDEYGCAISYVSQINRNLTGMRFTKKTVFEPHLDDIKETGNIGEMADLVISIFDPYRYKSDDENYGNPTRFRDPDTGQLHFRKLKILKNTYGIDGMGLGTVLLGQVGLFKELPKSKIVNEWDETDFESIFVKGKYSYFLD